MWNWHVNDVIHCAILHALLWHDEHNFDSFLLHLVVVAQDLFIDDALLNSHLRYTRNRLVRVSTIRSETRSCGITLTFRWGCQRSVSLYIVTVGLLDHFLRFFIRELLTHTFLHVALNLRTRLQLCSTARSARSDSSLAWSSS